MNYQPRLPSQAELQPAPDVIFRPKDLTGTAASRDGKTHTALSTGELAFRTLAAFRAHPHVSNVLTHISGANWAKVEQSLNRILDVTTTSNTLSPLEQNIVDLMCGDRGTTGRIFKPYFHAILLRVLEPDRAERLIGHIYALFVEIEWKAQQPAQAVPAPSEPLSQEPDHVGIEQQGTCHQG